MRKIVLSLLAFSLLFSVAHAQSCSPSGGVTCTQNLDLWLPPANYQNWNVPLNLNFGIIDAAVGNPGIVKQIDPSGDVGAAVNATWDTANVVELTAGNATATTTITIPNAATGLNGIPGALIVRGTGTLTVPQILFQDSTVASVPSGLLACPDGATIMLANGSNRTLISNTNFSSLTGSTSWYGAFQARIQGCALDANKANNSSGWAVQLYGRAVQLDDGQSYYGAEGGIWIELNHAGTGYTTPLDNSGGLVRNWTSNFNTGPGLNIHSGDVILDDVSTFLNSTWGLISSYNGVHLHGLYSFGNTLGGCWATTTGALAGDDVDCDTYTSGIGIFEDYTAGPMSISSGGIGGPGIGILVEQPGNVFHGSVLGSTGATDVKFGDGTHSGSGAFFGQFCTGVGGYLFDFTGGENGGSSIMTSQECSNGTIFNGTPNSIDTIFIPSNSASGSPFSQLAPQSSLTLSTSTGAIQLFPGTPFNLLSSSTSNTGSPQNFEIAGPSTSQLSEIDLNAANVDTTGNVNVAPGFNFEIGGAPLTTGNLADWSNTGIANADVPIWNSVASKWAPGVLFQSATTASIGGSALTAGQCASGTATLTSSATGHAGTAAPSDGSNIQTSGSGLYTTPQVTVSGTTATVQICDIIDGTPSAKTYTVTVF